MGRNFHLSLLSSFAHTHTRSKIQNRQIQNINISRHFTTITIYLYSWMIYCINGMSLHNATQLPTIISHYTCVCIVYIKNRKMPSAAAASGFLLFVFLFRVYKKISLPIKNTLSSLLYHNVLSSHLSS